MTRTLVLTNDFPPRQGGIEAFVSALCCRLPRAGVVVYTAATPGAAAFDAALPYPVVRDRAGLLLPTAGLARRVRDVLRSERCDRVLFGSAVPLGLLAAGLRRAGAERLVALTHGHETWWARLPGPRSALRAVGERTDVLTFLGEYTRAAIAGALSPAAASRMVRLTPGVDAAAFRPGLGRAEIRRMHGIPEDAPVVACVARLRARKGQDTLVEAWPRVVRRVPGAVLLLVGAGPYRRELDRRVAASGVSDRVVFAGPVPWARIPPYFGAADVFAMPCRTRLAGLEPEALGIVFLEAQASGLPVVVGDSGGAPDACRHGETGYVVDPRDPAAVADRIATLLAEPERARAMGERGRDWVRAEWSWDRSAARLRELLDV